ncbi:MAG: tRNA pseudouridine(55) synthase TruB [Gemmatimonadota bacterium]|nr:tRNA pseudouridine(55) synthase TruB [Gemmatimonadota bacterium]
MVDKPAGPTSHDVVDAVRRAVGIRRVGHTGTLDPFASGLLMLLVGRATRLARYLVGLTKTYVGTIRLGVRTDTDDRTGTVLETVDRWQSIPTEHVRAAMASLTGHGVQLPPAYSARKTAGVPAYRRARRGEAVALEAREIEVSAFDLVSHQGSAVEFHADVSSGTYLRALARDVGVELACGAHLESLRRTSIGPFHVHAAMAFAALDLGVPSLGPPREAVPHLPTYEIDDEAFDAVRHGRPIAAPPDSDGVIALVRDHDLVAIAECQEKLLKPSVVLTRA